MDEGAAPAMVLSAWKDGQAAAEMAAGQADIDTVFDLASLTKPLAAALVALDLDVKGIAPWAASLTDVWGPATPAEKTGITIERLLNHSAGFPAYRTYYTLLEQNPVQHRRGLLKAMLANEPLGCQPGEKAVYSDLGYMALGLVLEEMSGQPLTALVSAVYESLGVDGPRFIPLDKPSPWPLERIAPCGPLPGRETVHGQVEDENAYALGGVAGHAGLFGTARQAASVLDAVCRAAKGDGPWPAENAARLWRLDQNTPGSTRTPCFDTPSGPASAAGEKHPSGLVGHLGFTGVSLWWHPQSGSGIVLLTNRVALGRDNEKNKEFRRRVHTLAWRALGL